MLNFMILWGIMGFILALCFEPPAKVNIAQSIFACFLFGPVMWVVFLLNVIWYILGDKE